MKIKKGLEIRIGRDKEGNRVIRKSSIWPVIRQCRSHAVRAGKTIAACFMTVCLTAGLFTVFGSDDALAASSPFSSNSYTHNTKFNGNLILNGVDVSWYQAIGSNWKTAREQGVDFAILRATWTTYAKGRLKCDIDSHFLTHYNKAKAEGILCGVYHFSQATTVAEAKAEANYIIDRLQACGIGPEDLELPVYMDYEYAGNSRTGRLYGITSSMAKKCAKAFCNTVRNRGYKPGIYANLLFFRNMLNNAKGFDKDIDLWCAQYYSMCTSECSYTKWQYSSSGIIGSKKNGMLSEYTGKVGYTDINFWYINKNANPSASTITEIWGPTWFKDSSAVPVFAVYQGSKLLKQNVDYTVSVIENNGTTAYAYIRGIGDYYGYAIVPISFGANYVERTQIASNMVFNHKETRRSGKDTDDNEKNDAETYPAGEESTAGEDEASGDEAAATDSAGTAETLAGADGADTAGTEGAGADGTDPAGTEGIGADSIDAAETGAADADGTNAAGIGIANGEESAASGEKSFAADVDASVTGEGAEAANGDAYAVTDNKAATMRVRSANAVAAESVVTRDADSNSANAAGSVETEIADGEEIALSDEKAAAAGGDASVAEEGVESNEAAGTDSETVATGGDASSAVEAADAANGNDAAGTDEAAATDASAPDTSESAESIDIEEEAAGEKTATGEEAAYAAAKEEGNYRIGTKYISKIETGTTVKAFLSRLDAGKGYTIKVINNRGQEQSDSTVLTTGMMLAVYQGANLAGTAELRVDGSRIYGLANYIKVFVKKTSVKKYTRLSKGFTVTVSKAKGAEGYQIKYSEKKNMSGAVTKTLSNSGSVTSGTFTGLRSKKAYYVRVRSYRTVKGKKFYSGWSSIKKIRTRK